MKKTLAIILFVVMLFSCLFIPCASAKVTAAVLTLNGNSFSVPVKSTVTYTLSLKTPELIENGQFTLSYPREVLAVKNAKLPNIESYMLNYTDNVKNKVKFNFSNINGYDFTDEKTLITIEFEVRSSGVGEISLTKELMYNLSDVNIIDECTFTESLTCSEKIPELSAQSKSLKAGKTFTLKVKNTSETVSFLSSDKSVAKVNKKGVVTALAKGSTTITATTASGTSLNCTVSVTSNPKLSKQKIKIKANNIKKVKITGKAKLVNNKYINTKIAKVTSKPSVSTLKIKGLREGVTMLKIKVNKKVLKLKVTVTK